MLRLTTRHYTERESKLEVFIKSLPQEFREPYRREGENIGRVRGVKKTRVQDPLNQLRKVYMSSEIEEASPSYSAYIYYSYYLSVLWDS